MDHWCAAGSWAMAVPNGIRLDTLEGTAPLEFIEIVISRAASIKNKRGRHTRVLVLSDIGVAFWNAQPPHDEPIAMYPPRGEEEAGNMWQMKRSDVWDKTCIAALPRGHERGSSKKRPCSAQGMPPSFCTALRRTRWLQSTATTSQKASPRS